MSGTATNRCCCDCVGMGLPIFTDWNVNRGAWASGNSYAVGDLVFSGAPAAYYVCTQAHFAVDSSVQPPNATYWTLADRALKCLYVEMANIGFKDCMSLVGIEDGETETTTGPRVRLSEYSIWIPDKWLLRQRKPYPDAEGYQNRLLYFYGGGIGTGCWWSHLCDCDSDIYTEVVTVQTQVGLITTYTDSYHSAFTIQAIFTENEVEVVIFGGLFPYSSGADGDYTPEVGTHTPCKHPTLWMSVEMELFRGKATIPAGWIDAYGEASSTITISNGWSCSDIGTVLEPGTVPTGHIRPLGRRIVGAGSGTVKLTPPHALGWQDNISNAVVSCGTVPPCDAGDPPQPPPPWCPGCGPGGPGGGGGGGGGHIPPPPPPPPKRRYAPVNKCSGGQYGEWVDYGTYAPGTVLLVENSIGALVCVVISGDVKIAEAPPGPMLSGVISNFGQRSCAECEACYRLERCDGLENLFTRDDLSAVVGKVVDVGGECYTVYEAENCPQEDHPSIGDEREDCDDPACGPADPCESCGGPQPDCTVTLNGAWDGDCTFFGGPNSPSGTYTATDPGLCSFYECCWAWRKAIVGPFSTTYHYVFVYYKDGVFTVIHDGTNNVGWTPVEANLSCDPETGELSGSVTLTDAVLEGCTGDCGLDCPSVTIVFGG
ncbi:MAG: hypothetical protein Kow00105_12210 [Phycisphaeraceae bacterium]